MQHPRHECESFTADPIINREKHPVHKSSTRTVLLTDYTSERSSSGHGSGFARGLIFMRSRYQPITAGYSTSQANALSARQHASPSARENLASPITSTSTMTPVFIFISKVRRT
jgi:hypothetical protein